MHSGFSSKHSLLKEGKRTEIGANNQFLGHKTLGVKSAAGIWRQM